MERKMISVVEMENHEKQSLEFAKERSDGAACAIKNSLVPLLPDNINKDTKRDTPHSAINIVSAPTQPPNGTSYSWHAPSDAQPGSNQLPEERGPVATKE